MTRPHLPTLLAVLLLLLLSAAACLAQPLAPGAFAWRAPLELPAGASVARVSLPADAMLQFQSRDARDLRVFNAASEAVPFAFMPAPPAAASSTRSYPALPLKTAPAAAGRAPGTVQVRIDEGGQQRSVWVQLDGSLSATGEAGPRAAIFATRDEQQALKALKVQATLPANTPIQLRVSTSVDLAQWSPLPVRGRLYRFEGEGAPANDTLEFETPVRLQGRYLRLDWDSQAALSIDAVTGVVAPALPTPASLRAPLPPARPADKGALEIETGFLTPLAAIALATGKPNTLLPVRILGRDEPGQPWRVLAHTVVYRLGDGANEGTNPPAALYGASARWLRIESSSGVELEAQQIQASAEFEPLQLAFVATGAPPFELAAGRAGTPRAAVPLATIASALPKRKVQDLPEASVGVPTRQTHQGSTLFGWTLPGAPGKPALLWSVLIAGVLILAAVAWSLLRQLKADALKS
jgi:hypothetical protein